MRSSNKNSGGNTAGGIGFVGVLTVAFIVLKLTGFIDWSWWWVLSPMLIVIGLVVAFWIIVYLFVKRKW